MAEQQPWEALTMPVRHALDGSGHFVVHGSATNQPTSPVAAGCTPPGVVPIPVTAEEAQVVEEVARSAHLHVASSSAPSASSRSSTRKRPASSSSSSPATSCAETDLLVGDLLHALDEQEQAHESTKHTEEDYAERGRRWLKTLGVEELKQRFSRAVYLRLVETESPFRAKIVKDIRRTFPTHAFYRESKEHCDSLYKIVSAYSVYDSDVGYSQGMAFIAGFLFLHMSEEDAFWSMVRMMCDLKYNLRELFNGHSDLLMLCLKEFDHLLERFMPQLAAHVAACGIDASVYAPQWWLTLFVYRFPIECLPAIWEQVMARGTVAVFQIGLVILGYYHDEIMRLNEDTAIPFFNSLDSIPAEVLRRAEQVALDPSELKYVGDSFKFEAG